VALRVAVVVGAKVEKSVASPSFTFLSQSRICEAVLAASFAGVVSETSTVKGVMATSSCRCVGVEVEESVARPSFTSLPGSYL
jgi:hypothetical protein